MVPQKRKASCDSIRILPHSSGSLGDSFKRKSLLLGLEQFLSSLGRVEREYVFCPGRRFRFDYALPEKMIAVEVDGGIWKLGRHNRPQTFQRDLEKFNRASAMGWRIFRYTYEMLARRDYEIDIRELLYALDA